MLQESILSEARNAKANGRSVRGHGWGNGSPGSGFFGQQSRCVARFPLSCTHRSKMRAGQPRRPQDTRNGMLEPHALSKSMGRILGCSRHATTHNAYTIRAAASSVPSPKLVCSTSLRSRLMCCSITQLSASIISNGRQLHWA